MRGTVLRVAGLAAAALAALGAFLSFAPGHTQLALHVYLLVVGAVALAALVLRMAGGRHGSHGSAFERALAAPAPDQPRLPELAKLERTLELAAANAFDVHFRLRPIARDTVSQLLATRHGIDLDRNPDAARRVLDPVVWDLVRSDRPPPADRGGRGASPEELADLISALERV